MNDYPIFFEQNPNIHIDFQPTLVHNNTPDQKRKWGHHAQDPDSPSHPRRHPIVPAHLHPRAPSSKPHSPPDPLPAPILFHKIGRTSPSFIIAPLPTHRCSPTSTLPRPSYKRNPWPPLRHLPVLLSNETAKQSHPTTRSSTHPFRESSLPTIQQNKATNPRGDRYLTRLHNFCKTKPPPHCLPPIMHHPKRHETKPAPPASNQPTTRPLFFKTKPILRPQLTINDAPSNPSPILQNEAIYIVSY